MAYKPKVLAVTEGGTGLSGFSANQIFYASGTNTISALANGSLNQILKATATAPTWVDPPVGNGYTLQVITGQNTSTLATNKTYFMTNGYDISLNQGELASTTLMIPKAGTAKAFYGSFYNASTGSNTATTFKIYLNNVANTTVSSSLDFSNSIITFNSALNISVSAGDYLAMALLTPAWGVVPFGVRFMGVIYVE